MINIKNSKDHIKSMATPSFSFEGTLTLLHPPAIIHPAVTSHHTTITPTTKLRKPGRLNRRPRQLSSTVGLSSSSSFTPSCRNSILTAAPPSSSSSMAAGGVRVCQVSLRVPGLWVWPNPAQAGGPKTLQHHPSSSNNIYNNNTVGNQVWPLTYQTW